MARKIWNFELDGKTHKVELKHGYLSGKREIHVDGKKLELKKSDGKILFDTGSHHDFTIGTHVCTILIATNGLTYNYDLLIDRISQKSGGEISGDLNKLKFGAFFFNKIDNKEIANEIIKLESYSIVGFTVFSALIASLFMGNNGGWLDVFILALLAFWLFKRKSFVAAALLVLLTGATVIVTFLNRVNNEGGANLYLAVIIFYIAIRGLQATYWLMKNKKQASFK